MIQIFSSIWISRYQTSNNSALFVYPKFFNIPEYDEDLGQTSLQPFLSFNKTYLFAITYLLIDLLGNCNKHWLTCSSSFFSLQWWVSTFFFLVRKFTCFMKTLLITDHKTFDLLLVNYSCLSWNSLWIFTYIVHKSIVWLSTHIHSGNIAWLLHHGWISMNEFVLVWCKNYSLV